MDFEHDSGRFLPARVYLRWKWAARFGLLIIPMLFLICGGLILFLTPNEFRSTALIEIENGRSPQETAKMCKSSAILDRVIDDHGISNVLQLDRETTRDRLGEAVQAKVIPDTRLIEISVSLPLKEMARNVATGIPQNLVKFEGDRVRKESEDKISRLDQLIQDARDASAEKAVAVTKIEKLHGAESSDPAVLRDLERARRSSLVADTEVERLRVLRADVVTDILSAEPRLIVHTEPTIANSPANPKIGPELDHLLLEALIAGLTAAIVLPYLCELLFPAVKSCEMPLDVVYDL